MVAFGHLVHGLGTILVLLASVANVVVIVLAFFSYILYTLYYMLIISIINLCSTLFVFSLGWGDWSVFVSNIILYSIQKYGGRV